MKHETDDKINSQLGGLFLDKACQLGLTSKEQSDKLLESTQTCYKTSLVLGVISIILMIMMVLVLAHSYHLSLSLERIIGQFDEVVIEQVEEEIIEQSIDDGSTNNNQNITIGK